MFINFVFSRHFRNLMKGTKKPVTALLQHSLYTNQLTREHSRNARFRNRLFPVPSRIGPLCVGHIKEDPIVHLRSLNCEQYAYSCWVPLCLADKVKMVPPLQNANVPMYGLHIVLLHMEHIELSEKEQNLVRVKNELGVMCGTESHTLSMVFHIEELQ